MALSVHLIDLALLAQDKNKRTSKTGTVPEMNKVCPAINCNRKAGITLARTGSIT